MAPVLARCGVIFYPDDVTIVAGRCSRSFLLRPGLRFLGGASVLTAGAIIALHGKDDYACGIYPALFAPGGVPPEGWTARLPALRPVLLSLCPLAGAVPLPLVLPVLSEQAFLRYSRAVLQPIQAVPRPSEHHAQCALPQYYAALHGREELTGAVAQAVAKPLPEERARAVIETPDYGVASALNFFGPRLGLPPAISGHNQSFPWGPAGRTGDVLIDVDGACGARVRSFRETADGAVSGAPGAMPCADQLPIPICRGIRAPLAAVWGAFKHYE